MISPRFVESINITRYSRKTVKIYENLTEFGHNFNEHACFFSWLHPAVGVDSAKSGSGWEPSRSDSSPTGIPNFFQIGQLPTGILSILNRMHHDPWQGWTHPVPLRLENRQFLGNYLGPPCPQIHSKFSFLGNFRKFKKIIKFQKFRQNFIKIASKNDDFDHVL